MKTETITDPKILNAAIERMRERAEAAESSLMEMIRYVGRAKLLLGKDLATRPLDEAVAVHVRALKNATDRADTADRRIAHGAELVEKLLDAMATKGLNSRQIRALGAVARWGRESAKPKAKSRADRIRQQVQGDASRPSPYKR